MFLNKNIFVIYRGPNVCISCPIVLKVEWFKVEICQKCMYSFTAFIFLYLMMNFLFIVDKTFGFLIHGFSISTKLLNYFLAFVIRYTLGVFLSYKPCVITTRIKRTTLIFTINTFQQFNVQVTLKPAEINTVIIQVSWLLW